MNSWEDADFRAAVEATGRKKLIITALWTEVCVTFPALDALREGYEVYVVADAIGGTSLAAHEAAMRRIEQAGGKMISVLQLFCELQRDWGARRRSRSGHRADDLLGHLLGVAEQHHGVVLVEQRVVDAGVARRHRALDEEHRLGLVDVEHRHAVDRRCGSFLAAGLVMSLAPIT